MFKGCHWIDSAISCKWHQAICCLILVVVLKGWLSARLQYLQCISNGDTAVWHWDLKMMLNLHLTRIHFEMQKQYRNEFCGFAKGRKKQKTTGCTWVNPLWPSDAVWQHRSAWTLAQVMTFCLTGPSHYLNQFWSCCGISMRRVSQEVIRISICKISLNIALFKLLTHMLWDNELIVGLTDLSFMNAMVGAAILAPCLEWVHRMHRRGMHCIEADAHCKARGPVTQTSAIQTKSLLSTSIFGRFLSKDLLCWHGCSCASSSN